MSTSFRPTLESLERREVFSADLALCLDAAPTLEPADAAAVQVAAGDVNGDGSAELAADKTLSLAGDGVGLFDLLPHVEQQNMGFQGGCNGNPDAVDAVFSDVAQRSMTALLPYIEQDNLYRQFSALSDPAMEIERQQIIAILIGLLQKSGSETERMADITDSTSNTKAGGEVVSGEFVRMAGVTDGTSNTLLGALRDATPEQRSQIIAILIG